jgi:hypothetical protein
MTPMNNIPKTIFKYEDFTVHSLLNLKSQSVYFGSPKNFNDPYDCAITAVIADPTPDELERLLRYFMDDPGVPTVEKINLSQLPPQERKVLLTKTAEMSLKENRDKFLTEKGVSCFSERNDDLLMWSHYGGRYKGFCFEFRTEYEPFNKLRKVQYVKKMPTISIDSFIVKTGFQFIDLFCTKSDAWAYEQEWRGLHKEAGIAFGYVPEALKAVYFGPDIERQALEIVCLILDGQNPEVELWRSVRSESEFKVNFTSFTYTSFIKAKRGGLA